ncbi:MAG TPA: DUF2059 domain-containing protein [Burkholderiaceae bacterium]|nr:DUF2059 domain-containing protein [Burkholderiaceae bacterium]
MKRTIAMALLAGAALAAHAQTAPTTTVSPAKKALVAKVIKLQHDSIENLARGIVERPARQLMQAAARALQTQVAPDKREAVAKSIESDIRQFVDESTPVLRERALKIAPATLGPILEEKLSEDDLKQVVAWLESPAAKHFQQVAGELQQALAQKVAGEADSLLEPKLQALQQKIRTTLGVPTPTAQDQKPAAKAPAAKASGK